MYRTLIKTFLSLCISYILFIQPASAVKIVRLELEYGSDTIIATGGYDIPKTNKELDLELYEDQAPITVANFLNYVRNDRYDLTFFNRSITDSISVIQTGGVNVLTSDPDNDPLGETFGVVEKFPAILNEPGLSNLRGTIAMARISGEVNSADSEWYINLDDNLSLDSVDEGFTVFGKVIDDGIDTADQIASFPVINLSFLFGASYQALPFADIDPEPDAPIEDPYVQRNLVMILSAFEIERPILRFLPVAGNFGVAVTNDTNGKTIDVVFQNTGNESLDIGEINTDSLNPSFKILSDNCSNRSLVSDTSSMVSSCTLTIQFLPVAIGEFNDTLSVEYRSQSTGNVYSVKFSLSGTGSTTGVPEINVAESIDIGTSQISGFAVSKELVVSNIGLDSLQITEISNANVTNFEQDNNCIDNGVVIFPGESCEITIKFATNELGDKSSILTIESNDPVNSVVEVKLTGTGDSDTDGVGSAIENSAPNAGDANFDRLLDSQQNDVASYKTRDGEYISLIVDNKFVITDISEVAGQQDSLPEGITFKNGIFEYEIFVGTPGSIIEVGLILPSGDEPKALYIFGETADNDTPHWYRYSATQVLANVEFSSSRKNLIKLVVQDGGPGDADKEINGRIRIGPSITSFSEKDGSNSSINIFLIVIYFALLTLRYRQKLAKTSV